MLTLLLGGIGKFFVQARSSGGGENPNRFFFLQSELQDTSHGKHFSRFLWWVAGHLFVAHSCGPSLHFGGFLCLLCTMVSAKPVGAGGGARTCRVDWRGSVLIFPWMFCEGTCVLGLWMVFDVLYCAEILFIVDWALLKPMSNFEETW